MTHSRWASAGLVLLSVVVAAAFLAPGPSAVAPIPAELKGPELAFADRVERLDAMVNAVPSSTSSPASSSITVGENIQVFDDPQPQNEIAIAADPTDPDKLIVGANDYRLRAEGYSVWVGMYTSTNGGETWTDHLVPGYPGGDASTLSTFNFGGDPIVAVDSEGRMYAGGIFFRGTRTGADIRDVSIALTWSDDQGNTWSDPVIVSPGKAQSVFNDHPQMAVDNSGGTYDGNVYISYSKFTGLNADIRVAASRDRGETWSIVKVSAPIAPGHAAGGYQDSMVTIGPGGEVYVFWDETYFTPGAVSRADIWMTVSTDGGMTFAAPWVAMSGVVPIFLPKASYRYDTYPAAAVDHTGEQPGRIYLTWADGQSGNADIYLSSSDDGGMTWGDPVRVNDDDGEAGQFFQWVSVAPDGRVDIAFYDRRDDPNDYLLNEYYAVSTDGGLTFTNERVSDASSDPAVWSAFIGDYNQIASTPDAAYPAWCDMRNGEPGNRNQDAYTAAVTP